MSKIRVDTLLHEQGLAESRSQAQRLIMAGLVRADGQLVHKPATQVPRSAQLTVSEGQRFVSRGGEKLAAALEAFSVDPTGWNCADVGASTGGFTDCLLQAGARRVYAIEVGNGILHWKIRQDPRVLVMEGVNARYLEVLEAPVRLVTVDVSFISLKLILPVIKGWANSGSNGDVLALIKPQFEAGKAEVSRGKGVIKDSQVHKRVLTEVLQFARSLEFSVQGLMVSPLRGPKGNIEFFAWLIHPGRQDNDLVGMIDAVISDE